MELRCENMVVLQHRSKRSSIVANRDGVFGMLRGEGMREIKIVRFTEPREQGRRFYDAQAVPAHVGKLDVVRQAFDAVRQQRQSGKLGSFFARGEERLEAQTDAEKGDSAPDCFKQRDTQVLGVQGANDRCIVADAG